MATGALNGSLTAIPMEDQLIKLKNMWDPTHQDNAFQHYFYNKVPADQVALYSKPPHHPQNKWDEAVRNRPDGSQVPVLAVGFGDLQKRTNLQQQQVATYRVRMHQIVDVLGQLQQKHALDTSTRIQSVKTSHSLLLQRTTLLAGKIQVLKYRGYAMRPDEQLARQKLQKLVGQTRDKHKFGALKEVKARLDMTNGVTSVAQGIDWERDQNSLKDIEKVISKLQFG